MSHLEYKFENGDEAWTADEKTLAVDGMARWTTMRSVNDVPLFTMSQDNVSPNVVLKRMDDDGTSSHADCSVYPRVIYVHSPPATFANPGSMITTPLHESGHIRSLDHVGDGETKMWNGTADVTRQPRMSGCAPHGFPHSSYPESDDWAQAVAKFWGTSNPLGPFNPDAGFESYNHTPSTDAQRSLKVWSGAQDRVASGSSSYVSVRSTPLEQIVRINNPPPRLRFKARYKMGSSATSANFKLFYRRISYPAATPCGSPPANSFDVNSPTYVGGSGAWVQGGSISVLGNTNWGTTGWIPTTPVAGQPFGNGIDVKITAVNTAPSPADLYVDDFIAESIN